MQGILAHMNIISIVIWTWVNTWSADVTHLQIMILQGALGFMWMCELSLDLACAVQISWPLCRQSWESVIEWCTFILFKQSTPQQPLPLYYTEQAVFIVHVLPDFRRMFCNSAPLCQVCHIAVAAYRQVCCYCACLCKPWLEVVMALWDPAQLMPCSCNQQNKLH